MKRATAEMMNMARSVRIAMLHAEAIKEDLDREEAKNQPRVCDLIYTQDAYGRPLVVLSEDEIPY
ncbi:MAG: hypothetical protein EOM46_28745 [Gammaproteobacteria bacterium]|nr:hypothetical protein [Gammaproteobacteria bacterium]